MNELQEIYANATMFAMKNNQTVGEKHDYYITLEQLEGLIKAIEKDK